MPQTRTRSCFQKIRLLQKLPVPPYMGISPTSGRRAMKNMQLVGAIDLGLRLAVRNDATERVGGVNRAALFVFHSHIKRGVLGETIREQRVDADLACARHPRRN